VILYSSDKMTYKTPYNPSRRNILRGICATGVGLALTLNPLSPEVFGSVGLGERGREHSTLEDELMLQPEILFNSNRINGKGDVFLMDANGDNQRPLTNNNCTNYNGSWFPDGKKVIYGLRGRDKIYRIGLVNSDGTGQKILPNFPGENRFNPKCYPDGRSISYLSVVGGVGNICRIDTDGNFLANLTQGIEGSKRDYAISPNGEELAVIVENRGDEKVITPGDVVIMDSVDGGNRRTLLERSVYPSPPLWSPDGEYLYFMFFDRGGCDAFRVNQADGNKVILTEGRGDGKSFTLSPNGEKFYYTSNNQGRHEIFGVNSNGEGERTRLTDDDFSGWSPAISPDGKFLAGVTKEENGVWDQIFAMKISEPWKRKVLTKIGNNHSPAWRPK